MDRGTWIGNGDAAEKVSLTAWDDVLGFPGFEIETIQGLNMTVCYFYALTEQGFVYVGRAFGYDVDDAAEGDGAWPLDLTGDGRSELITRSTFGDGISCVFVYRWNAAEGGSQRSEVDWDKADAQLARLSAPLGVDRAGGDLSRTGQYRYADALHGKRHEGNDAAAYHRYSRRVVCR